METKNELKSNYNSDKKTKKYDKKISSEEELLMRIKPTILLRGPFRYIMDYPHIYKSFVKQRWENRTIVDIFSKEFRSDPIEYYKKAIAEGKIRVNGKEISEDYKLKMNDIVEHETIRKEPPVYNLPIEIIYEDDELLIINKPPSIPVHVCGHHSFNTIMGILRTDFNYKDIYMLHRLDKLTSGILLIAKNAELAAHFHEELKDKKVEKLYLARVHGNLLTDTAENQEIVVNKPIYCVSHKDAQQDVCEEDEKVKKNAKDACTKFKSIWFDEKSNTTLLECRPITGKTHQIRVHLKSLGHSIVNDTSYGGKFLGNLITKYLDKKEDSEEKIVKKIKLDDKGNDKKIIVNNSKEEEKKEEEKDEKLKKDEKFEKYSEGWIEKDLNSHVLEIWLHSYKYKFRGKVYATKMPYWAVHKNIEF